MTEAVEMACRNPRLVARRAVRAGLCEVDLYLETQKLYGEICRKDKFAAEIFADELKEKGLTLACS